jgi:hypothetical protein
MILIPFLPSPRDFDNPIFVDILRVVIVFVISILGGYGFNILYQKIITNKK